MAPDRAVKKIAVRLIRSFHSIDRVPSKLHCSVAKMVAASGSNGWSLATVGLAVPSSPRASLYGLASRPLASVVSIAEPPEVRADVACRGLPGG
jgi:hypothetical protein